MKLRKLVEGIRTQLGEVRSPAGGRTAIRVPASKSYTKQLNKKGVLV